MLLLDAINFMLPKLGEHEITSVDDRHPTVAVITPEIEDSLRTLLNRGWWFNEFETTLYPDTNKNINLGTDVLSVVPLRGYKAVQRGRRLYNPATLDYEFSEPLPCKVRQYVQFEEIPETAAIFVRNTALCVVYTADIGITTEIQKWESQSMKAESDLVAEHLRNKKYNTKNSRPGRNLRRALVG